MAIIERVCLAVSGSSTAMTAQVSKMMETPRFGTTE